MTNTDGSTAMPQPPAGRRSFYPAWIMLLAGAIVVRAAFLGCRLVLSGDEIHYAESLHRFMEGRFVEGVSDYWSFFYPFLALPFGKIYGSAEPALRVLSVICGGAVVVPCMLIARRLWGDRTALFTGIIVALHPNLIQFSTAAMTEPLYMLLVATALYLIIRIMQDGGRWFSVICGIVIGLAYLTRQEAQFILAVFAVVILLRPREYPRGRRIAGAALLVAFFVLTVVPHAFLMRAKTGRWMGGSKASVNLSSPLIWEDGLDRERYVYSLNESGTGRRIDEIGRESALAMLWRQRSMVASRYFPNLTRGVALLPNLFASPFLLLLVPLGLFGRAWRRNDRTAEFILLVMGIFPFILYSIFRVDFRYLVPFLPVYILWGASGCGVLVSWLRENISPRPVLSVIALFVILASLIPFTVRRYALIAASQPVEYREIGRWIRENGGEGRRVLAPSGWSVGYYAGNPVATYIPWTDPEGLIRFARYNRFEYLVFGAGYIESARPTLIPLVGGQDHAGLDYLHAWKDRAGKSILIYKVVELPEL